MLRLILLSAWSVALLASVMSFAAFTGLPAFAQGNVLQTFVLKDDIGQNWSHDLVFFPLGHPLSIPERVGVTLLGPDETIVPCQFSSEGTVTKIAFLASLPKYGESTYRLMRQTPKTAPPPFQIERNASSLRVSNGITGVEVPTAAGRYQDGPILGIRMKSGKWIGGSRLTTTQTIETYEVRVTAEGPVFVDLECRYRFANGKTWILRLRIIAGEPVMLIHETFDLGDDSHWEFLAGPNFSPNQVYRRIESFGPYETYSISPLTHQGNITQVQLCPWVPWWDQRNAAFFGVFHAPDGITFVRDDAQQRLLVKAALQQPVANDWDDMLIAAAGDVAAWSRPDENLFTKFVPLHVAADGQLALQLQLASPGRRWFLGAGSVKESLVTDTEVAPVQQLRNRYCETPLDTVKDMPLHWQHTATYPRLMMNRAEVKRLVASPDFEKILANNPRWPGTYQAMKRVLLQRIAGQPVTTNQAQIDELKRNIIEMKHGIRYVVEYFRYGNNRRSAAMFGTIIPRVDIGFVLPWMDLALGADIFTPAEKEQIFAQLAFVADKIASPDYESPGRSLVREPNIETAWSASLVLMACMMPDHPHAHAWYREGMGRLDAILDKWQGPNGAWLESPHYQIAAISPIILAKTAAVNSGFLTEKRDERLLRTVMFLAQISTPPDPRFDNRRHLSPLGHTFLMETSQIFGAAAKLIRQQDPAKAAALQWMWQQQGKPHWVGIGGASMLDFYIELLADEDWNPPAPTWGSAWFPGFGVVLRSGLPGERETQLVYHQGEVATQRYEDDQGSFELWGKGRPLCLDWGFVGNAPAWQHNRIDIGDKGTVREFTTLPSADYLHGQQTDGSGGWERQLLFVKDRDPVRPTYFVLRDSTTGTGTANWWLWVNTRKDTALPAAAKSIQIIGDVICTVGEHDVDLDIWFAPQTRPALDTLEIKELSQTAITGFLDGSWSGGDGGKTTQQGLHLVQPRGEPLISLLYPRLRNEPAPQFTSLAGGKVIKVGTAVGIDYVFLSLEPFTFRDDSLAFSGTAGAIQVRGKQVTLVLSQGGEISYGKVKLVSPTPKAKTFRTF